MQAKDGGARGGPRLKGRVALVTGGGKGIGRAIALELASEGADVAVMATRDLSSAEEVASAITMAGRRAVAVAVDVTDRQSVEAAVARVGAELGLVDVLVNNAGAMAYAALEDADPADWDRVFAVNVKGPFLCGVAVARGMMASGGGAIVNIAGASAHRSYPLAGAFGPSKAALVSLTRQMSLEWARHGIRVNGVSPGPIREPDGAWQSREPVLAAEVLRGDLTEDCILAQRGGVGPPVFEIDAHVRTPSASSANAFACHVCRSLSPCGRQVSGICVVLRRRSSGSCILWPTACRHGSHAKKGPAGRVSVLTNSVPRPEVNSVKGSPSLTCR